MTCCANDAYLRARDNARLRQLAGEVASALADCEGWYEGHEHRVAITDAFEERLRDLTDEQPR